MNILKKILILAIGRRRRTIKPFNIIKAKIVILGTHPGRLSLEKKEYYSNPKNQFWDLLSIKDKDYRVKMKKLQAKGIGLWDVIKFCDRGGNSSDKNITNEIYNDLSVLKGKRIFFNGKRAYEYYLKANKNCHFDLLNISEKSILPSSSRACAIKNKKQKWQRALHNVAKIQ